MASLKFVTGERAALIENTLLVSDIHLGIEEEWVNPDITPASQTEKIKQSLDRLLRKTRAKRIIILGDLKHKIGGVSKLENKEVPEFLSWLSKKAKTTCIIGNHDAYLLDLVRRSGIDVELVKQGMISNGYYLSHGHCWPHKSCINTKAIVMGHAHPCFEFKDKLGYRWLEPVWIKARLGETFLRHYKVGNAPPLIIMPAFNSFAGGISIDRMKRKKDPLIQSIRPVVEAYLLDGTMIGKKRML